MNGNQNKYTYIIKYIHKFYIFIYIYKIQFVNTCYNAYKYNFIIHMNICTYIKICIYII